MEKKVFDHSPEEKRIKKNKPLARKIFLKKLLGGLGLIFTFYLYLRFEANWLEISRKKILISKLKNKAPIKILHLSDLHFSDNVSLNDIEFALREGFALSPDACMITGDFITNKIIANELDQLGKLLSKFAGIVPTFASLGNHDGGEWAGSRGGYKSTREIKQMLIRSRIKLLHNQSHSIYLKGQPFSLSGVGDLWSKTCRPHLCLTKRPFGNEMMPSILLCHNPDAKELLDPYQWDIMLCGHTHGGQFKIPFLNWTPFAPVRDHSMVEGLHTWKGRQIHITRGVGNLFGMRLNCRPEVSLLELGPV